MRRPAGGNLPFLLTCLTVSLALRLTVGVGVVSGYSMWPALAPGDMVVYVRHLPPAEGSVVVAELPGHGLIIKRVAGAAPGAVLLLGDNRDHSYDSRQFGPLRQEYIVGRVVLIWPRRPRPPEERPGIPSQPR